MLPSGDGEGFLPPAVQAFACIGVDGEGAEPRFVAGFGLLKLRANFLARRGRRPRVSSGSAHLEDGPKGPGEGTDDGLHLHGAIVARAGRQSSPPFAKVANAKARGRGGLENRLDGLQSRREVSRRPFSLTS